MAINIINLLQKGDLTPKERALLLIHNNISEERDGKSILSEADKYALIENWKPENNNEVDQYNKYNSGWRTTGMAELDAQTTYLNAQLAYYRREFIFFTSDDIEINRDGEKTIDAIHKRMREDLILGYGTLLAFKELFDRLSKAYEIDLSYKIDNWLKDIGDIIDTHNVFIADNAKVYVGQDKVIKRKEFVKDEGKSELAKWFRQVAKTNNEKIASLVIDKDIIKPDKTRAGGYFTEFEKILGRDF